ncbi:hypothetical protein B0T26DRAFT_736747 [Lasiosphaeria miniovina]|uniref:Uncharacterized protein n=1 Tax=Lasiosphaeria miniovina TaxID=1954250 RepID=A0AA40BGR9_9PEZI|nr:uncharacterized protein B0T26DRAFT_736747 [Lasiosphaeria miniovina]KAK0733945.1 hypothetical protein B0T26DRAFT_736747 [Lasiosphaeria miniovina]
MAAIAPMDLVMKAGPASIPLKCTLCPKKPNFSDLSHLLTHISSKSHLSHRFKIELRAQSERDAREAIRKYEEWYAGHGIMNLLAERMTAKEQKKPSKRGRPSNANARITTSREESVKREPREYTEPAPIQFPGTRQGYFDSAGFQTPVMKRSQPEYSTPNTPDNTLAVMRAKYRRWPSETETETTASVLPSDEQDDNGDFGDEENDSSKLKGIRYPGMGLFDSASDLQKRKRNQRKDESVLKKMEQSSSGIEPTEFVWTEGGVFQRTRDIYASPSIEGSPERNLGGTDNHKKKRTRRTATSAAVATRPRQTRASARIAQSKATSMNKSALREDSPLGQDEHENSQISSHSHGSVESFDVFRDPPQPSPSMPRFDLRRRPALQSLSSNMSLVSPASKPAKALTFFPARDNGPPSFPAQPHVSSNPYFQHQHSMGGGTFNPLCVQSRNGYFHPYYQGYGADPKPPNAGFQPVNTLNQNLGSMAFNSFTTPYSSDSPHERGHDFDM